VEEETTGLAYFAECQINIKMFAFKQKHSIPLYNLQDYLDENGHENFLFGT
jgi:hypothetical protein